MLKAEIDTRKLERAITILPKSLKFALGDAIDHIQLKFLKEFRKTRLQGPPHIRGKTYLYRQFKRTSIVSPTIEGMGGIIFADSKIAKLHETGGVVTDPSGGSLTVPLSARTEMYSKAGKLKKKYRSPANLKNVVRVTIKGKSFLAKVQPGKRGILPLFIFKKQVRLLPRLGFYDLWAGSFMQNERIRILNKAIDKALKTTA